MRNQHSETTSDTGSIEAPPWRAEDCCTTCRGTGCGDCGNTGLESEAVKHGLRRAEVQS